MAKAPSDLVQGTLDMLERDVLIAAEWRETGNDRRAKYYALTPRGRTALKAHTDAWQTQASAIARILKATPEEI